MQDAETNNDMVRTKKVLQIGYATTLKNNIAYMLSNMGRYDEAELLFRDVVKEHRQIGRRKRMILSKAFSRT